MRKVDKITLKGLKFTACHGYLDIEKSRPQAFIVDADLYADLFEAGTSDDLADTVNYSDVADLIEKIMVKAEPVNLIEHICEKICNHILNDFPAVKKVEVTVKKPAAPINVQCFDYVSVTMTRKREE